MQIEGVYRYHSSDRRLGEGYRLVIAHSRTARKVSLLAPATLCNIRVDADQLRHCIPVTYRARSLAALLDRRRRACRRYKLRHPAKIADELATALRASAGKS